MRFAPPEAAGTKRDTWQSISPVRPKNPAPVGFFVSDNGARTAAILTSSITTCKRLHIDSFAYLRDIFQHISAHPVNRLVELLHNNWKAAQETTQSLIA